MKAFLREQTYEELLEIKDRYYRHLQHPKRYNLGDVQKNIDQINNEFGRRQKIARKK